MDSFGQPCPVSFWFRTAVLSRCLLTMLQSPALMNERKNALRTRARGLENSLSLQVAQREKHTPILPSSKTRAIQDMPATPNRYEAPSPSGPHPPSSGDWYISVPARTQIWWDLWWVRTWVQDWRTQLGTCVGDDCWATSAYSRTCIDVCWATSDCVPGHVGPITNLVVVLWVQVCCAI